MSRLADFSARICLLGHPFAPIGKGEDIRSIFFALRAAGMFPEVIDIYGSHDPEISKTHQEIKKNLTKDFGEINIFIVNGDEINSALKHLGLTNMPNGKNIIYPSWELSHYPIEWAKILDNFDEIWAQSKFTYDCLRLATKKTVRHITNPSEVKLDSLLNRKYFGVPNEAFTFLFSFDYRSFITRKNPFSIIRCFKLLIKESKNHNHNPLLIIKTHGNNIPLSLNNDFQKILDQLEDKVIVINKLMSDNEARNLIRVCDCYISLHRSEGFGRGMAEAMTLGTPVIATRYSGNLDFMNDSNSFLVDYDLVDVGESEYPHGSGQQWANPNEDQALEFMRKIITDSDHRKKIEAKAQTDIRSSNGYRVVGLRIKNSLNEII